MQVTAHNRGPDPATLHVLPTLWFRNTWSWGDMVAKPASPRSTDGAGRRVRASHPELGEWLFTRGRLRELLFCENETNNQRLFGAPTPPRTSRTAINDFVVDGATDAVNPERTGTKVAAQHVLEMAPGESAKIRVRLHRLAPKAATADPLGATFDERR